jgi:exosome complex RNA-binding protein Rrp4
MNLMLSSATKKQAKELTKDMLQQLRIGDPVISRVAAGGITLAMTVRTHRCDAWHASARA